MWYLILRRPLRPREEWTVSLDQHLAWMKQQHEAGRILFSGPTPDRTLGIYVIRANSRQEAEKIASGDPFASRLMVTELFARSFTTISTSVPSGSAKSSSNSMTLPLAIPL